MSPNEIGQFPFWKAPKDSFHKDGYPREHMNKDLKFVPTFVSLGNVELIPYPEDGFATDNCVFDLQHGNDACYYAADVTINGVGYIYLLGNGWANLGFPFFDETFDPAEPYETGVGCYALIRGVARDEFLLRCKTNEMISFLSVTTGDIQKDFVLPDNT